MDRATLVLCILVGGSLAVACVSEKASGASEYSPAGWISVGLFLSIAGALIVEYTHVDMPVEFTMTAALSEPTVEE